MQFCSCLTSQGAEYPARVAVETATPRTPLRLSFAWSLLYPLAMMGVYTLVFSVLWKGARNIPHYPLFVLAGLAVWGFCQGAVQLCTGSLVMSADLIKKVWFPRELVVAAVVLAQNVSAGGKLLV